MCDWLMVFDCCETFCSPLMCLTQPLEATCLTKIDLFVKNNYFYVKHSPCYYTCRQTTGVATSQRGSRTPSLENEKKIKQAWNRKAGVQYAASTKLSCISIGNPDNRTGNHKSRLRQWDRQADRQTNRYKHNNLLGRCNKVRISRMSFDEGTTMLSWYRAVANAINTR